MMPFILRAMQFSQGHAVLIEIHVFYEHLKFRASIFCPNRSQIRYREIQDVVFSLLIPAETQKDSRHLQYLVDILAFFSSRPSVSTSRRPVCLFWLIEDTLIQAWRNVNLGKKKKKQTLLFILKHTHTNTQSNLIKHKYMEPHNKKRGHGEQEVSYVSSCVYEDCHSALLL